ncbi:MAG: copper-binding protein [Hyphomonadaceae bacterium]|nr:MAG: Copper binding periplasmic protein CusF [Caulobacteraceae bacterium]MBT9447574.1 copper-binding protein [Hyphomonadaceae bacterium]TPW07593.1 MAG: Copper binding periplasmic protein CusF [Alphaproteobacteria bacterium]
MKAKLIAGALAAALASGIMAAPAFAHRGETHAAVPQTAEGDGVVAAVNATAGTITVRHGPIAALRWPAMTMTFPVRSASMLTGVAVGARVHFTLMNHEGRPMVSELHVL